MTDRAPLLSYIVNSYNYERYIGQTIESILAQTTADYEVVVVDDASSDRSVDRIRSFADPRIRLIVNQSNLGGIASYNLAVEAARGEWLVNLDSDDWIAPRKSELQLAAAAADPSLDIIGTYVKFVDAAGAPDPAAKELEESANQPRDLQRVDCWIGVNPLCRSSTMVRRTAHLRIGGFSNPSMSRAPDYELWTRALREGCRFAVVPEPLTYKRQHSAGVTHGDPLATLLEMSYSMLRNLMPLVEARALNASLERMVDFVAGHEELCSLRPIEAFRLLGMFMTSPPLEDYVDFLAQIASADADPALARIGRRCLMIVGPSSSANRRAQNAEIAKDWWRNQSAAWENAYRQLSSKPFRSMLVGVRNWMRNRRAG
jgi:GT2 family glycosyltransferase